MGCLWKKYHNGLGHYCPTLTKYQCEDMGLHEFFNPSDIASCITFHIKLLSSFCFLCKVYRDILNIFMLLVNVKNVSVHFTIKTEKKRAILYENLCMKPWGGRCMDLVQTHKCSLLIMGPHIFQIKLC